MAASEIRPKYLNLLRIRMPVGAVTSFAHRLSGVLLFLALPYGLYLFDLSLQNPEGFARAAALVHTPLVRVLSILLVWSLAHHLLAGLRFLLIDLDIGVARRGARRSAWVVNMAALLLVLAYAGSIL
ncbi:MAG TPA: succinate dehydrogenase, cytochrome b556 subunit [Gammaproteobacteria bacterium]|nr:succinate dehydrogenase, cytochrome b556 subunit [Gammaproteobacteria bacterium]